MKLRQNINIFFLASILLILGGCTRNNGDIGPIFGKWKVESIIYEGIDEIPEYEENIFFAFQNSIIMVQTVLPLHVYLECFGNFSLDDNHLSLRFPDDSYEIPTPLMLPRESELEVKELHGGRMTLLYRPGNGEIITYKLKKW